MSEEPDRSEFANKLEALIHDSLGMSGSRRIIDTRGVEIELKRSLKRTALGSKLRKAKIRGLPTICHFFKIDGRGLMLGHRAAICRQAPRIAFNLTV